MGRRTAWVVLAASLVAFSLVHLMLIWRVHTNEVFWAHEHYGPHPERAGYYIASFLPFLLGSLARYLGLVLSALVLVRRGRTHVFAIPAVAWAVGAWWSVHALTMPPVIGDGLLQLAPGSTPTKVSLWSMFVLDLLLALAPAMTLVPSQRSATHATFRGRAVTPTGAAAVGLIGLVVWLAIWQPAVGASSPSFAELVALFPYLLFGLLFTFRRGSVLPLVLVPVLLTIRWFDSGMVDLSVGFSSLDGCWLPVALTLLASTWEPVAHMLERSQGRDRAMLVGVNLMNIADAVLTWMLVRTGDVDEANPFVRAMGFPAKIVLVAIASWAIYRWRPRALIWPGVALMAVLIWHLGGLISS